MPAESRNLSRRLKNRIDTIVGMFGYKTNNVKSGCFGKIYNVCLVDLDIGQTVILLRLFGVFDTLDSGTRAPLCLALSSLASKAKQTLGVQTCSDRQMIDYVFQKLTEERLQLGHGGHGHQALALLASQFSILGSTRAFLV